jgi:hypothetical protein
MSAGLEIIADPEILSEGSLEERACFAAVEIRYGSTSLTESYDEFVKRVRTAPMLSAYHLAEWMAWNWWRLRWEPRSNLPDWAFAHRLPSIGEGYVWPNVTIFSDGERVALIARPTQERLTTRFRYLADGAAVVAAPEFEYIVDQFIEQVRGLLRAQDVPESNLDRLWRDIHIERNDPALARRRKLEALLGQGPDENEAAFVRLVSNDGLLGARAVDEIAADYRHAHDLLVATRLRDLGSHGGFDFLPNQAVRLNAPVAFSSLGEVPAWRLGADAAIALRAQEGLGEGPIRNDRLAELVAVSVCALTPPPGDSDVSFALQTGRDAGRIVLRSKWETGRRFDLARLLGDRLVGADGESLLPATRAYTYRQKMQRSFAAELLSPFNQVDQSLSGDYSSESQEHVAEYFQVSPLTIRTLLVNHRRLDREDLDEFDAVASFA